MTGLDTPDTATRTLVMDIPDLTADAFFGGGCCVVLAEDVVRRRLSAPVLTGESCSLSRPL